MVLKTMAVHPNWHLMVQMCACMNTRPHICLSLVKPSNPTELEPRCRMPGEPVSSDPRQEFEAKWWWQREEPASSIPPSWRDGEEPRLSHGRTHFKSICCERLLLRPQLKAEMKRLRHVIDDPPLGRTSLACTINCRGRGSNSCWRVLFWSFITAHRTKTMIGVAQACDRRDLSLHTHSQCPESLSLTETNDYDLLHAS